MARENNNQSLPPRLKLRLPISYALLAVAAFTAVIVGYFPPENALLPPLVFISSLGLFVLLDIYAIRVGSARLISLVEWLFLGAALLMWPVLWVNGEPAFILMPAFVAIAGIYGLTHYKFLLLYSVGSVVLMALSLVFHPDLDPGVVGRAIISVVVVILMSFFLRGHIELLQSAERRQLRLDGTLKGILRAAKIDVFDERVSDGSGEFIHSYHAPDVEFVGGEKRLERVEPRFQEELVRNLAQLNVPTEFKFHIDPDQNQAQWYTQQTVYEYRDERGELHRIGFSRNIDEEVHNRNVLRAALQEQAEKNRIIEAEIEKFDAVCDKLEMVYWRVNLSDWRISYNRRFARRWGLPVGGEIAFRQFENFMRPQYFEFHEKALRTVIESKGTYRSRFQASLGESVGNWFELTYWPSFDAEGEMVAVNVVNVEITQLVEAEEQQRAINGELVRQRQREQNMYAVIGHEMRTPAAILKMQLEQERKGLGKIDRKLFESSVDQLLDVVDTLRTVSQPDKLVSRELKPSLLGELLANQVEIMQTLARSSGFSLKSDLRGVPEESLMLMQGPLKQLISNLIKNAILHSKGSEIRVSASQELMDSPEISVSISVDDNGRGIPDSEVDRLFEPYERGADSVNGTGLGLFVCLEIAKLMGGKLRYTTSPMGGAGFTLEWTARLAPADAASSPLDTDEPQQLEALSVLLVEDDVGILQMTASLLSAHCGTLRVAKNGRQALAILSGTQVDLVLTDIFMPEMSGIALVKQMRDRGYMQPVIGLTAATLGQETEELLAVGATAVLNKPVEIEELMKVVQKLKLQL